MHLGIPVRRTSVVCECILTLYKIWFCAWAFVQESILFSAHTPFVKAPPPRPVAHTIAQCNVTPDPPVLLYILYTIGGGNIV